MVLRPSNGEALCPTLAIGHEGTAAPSLFCWTGPNVCDAGVCDAKADGNTPGIVKATLLIYHHLLSARLQDGS
jgi:hypothetical protein